MAQSITLMNATYNDVPAVDLPKTGGGTARFTDVTDTTANAGQVLSGSFFYTPQGERTAGTLITSQVYYGTSEPSSSLGADGDLYILYEP